MDALSLVKHFKQSKLANTGASKPFRESSEKRLKLTDHDVTDILTKRRDFDVFWQVVLLATSLKFDTLNSYCQLRYSGDET